MDQRARDVEEDLKQILDTRLALGRKIDLLEQRVEDTVEGTKAAALATIDFARNKAVECIESATYHMNPAVQAERRPWVLVAGAIAVGFAAGLIEQGRRTSGVYPYYPPKATGADILPSPQRDDQPEIRSGSHPGSSQEAQLPSHRFEGSFKGIQENASSGWLSELGQPLFSLWDELADELIEEGRRLQGAVVYAGRSFIHDVARIAGRALLDQLNRPSPMAHRHGHLSNCK